MNDLSTLPLTMSTLEIAGLTGKAHKHVLADADKMLDALEIHSAEFSAQYRDASGKANRVLNLPKRECLILVSGYSVEMRAIGFEKDTSSRRFEGFCEKIGAISLISNGDRFPPFVDAASGSLGLPVGYPTGPHLQPF